MKSVITNKAFVFILFTIIAIAVYYNSFNNSFHFDDIHHIVNNKYIRSMGNIPTLFIDINTFSASREIAHYRPILMITHVINYAVGGLRPAGYHLVNLFFHIGSSFLIYLILIAILENSQQSALNSKQFAALAAGFIFLVHPFNTEVINYVSARSSVMSGFFYLLGFWCWVKFREQRTQLTPTPSALLRTGLTLPPQGGGNIGGITYFYIASIISFAAGMLTKESVITLPIVLWLYDLYFLNKPQAASRKLQILNWRSYVSYIPFVFFVAVPYIILRSYLVKSALSAKAPRGFFENILLQVKVLVKYIYLMFLPHGLSVEHDIAEVSSLMNPYVAGSFIILILITGLGVFLYKSKADEYRIISFYIFWFFITMLPTSILPLNAPLQENRGYIAGVGFAVILGIIISRFAIKNRYGDTLKTSALIIVLLLYSYGTVERNRYWKDDVSLWLDAIEKSPGSARAHINLGQTLYNNYGLEGLAINEYKKAIEIKSNQYIAMNNIGTIYLKNDRLDLALTQFKNAVEAEPLFIKGHMNLARVYVKLGQTDAARLECEQVLKIGEALNQEDENTAEARRYMKRLGNVSTTSSGVPEPQGQDLYFPP